jgi:hypothetical protein
MPPTRMTTATRILIFFIFNAPSTLLLLETNGEHHLSTRITIFSVREALQDF